MTEILWNNCDSLDGWRLGNPGATMELDTVDKTEGTASIVVRVPAPWTYVDLWHEEGHKDIRAYNKVRLDIKPDSDRNLVIQLVTRTPNEPTRYSTFDYVLTVAEHGIVLGQWNRDFDIILANPTRIIGTPNMADIHLQGYRMQTPLGTEVLKVDNIRLVYEPIPMTASLMPPQATIYTTQPQTFQADIIQGTGPYTVEWLINGSVEATETVGNAGDHMASAERIIDFTSAGLHVVQVRVTDSLGEQVLSNEATVTVESGGLLQIKAYANGTEVTVQVEVAGSTYYTPIEIWMPSGSHTVTAKYMSQTDSLTVDVLEGQTASLQFQFAYEPPFPTSLHIDGRYIKDSTGNVVILKSVNRHGFEDSPEGVWKDLENAYYRQFREDVVKANLDAMKAWGFNSFRIHFQCRWWLDPTLVGDTGLNMRQCFKLLAQWANERGLYVIFDAFSLGNPQGHHGIPWGTTTFPTLQDFINFWLSMVAELDQYPNVIYELFNEVTGDKDTWLDGCQATIAAMRTVTDHIIVVQYNWDVWHRETAPGGASWTYAIDRWALDPRIQGTNILFATHMYGDSRGFYQPEGSTVQTFFHTYADVRRAMVAEKLQEFVEVHNKPLWIGEYGEGTNQYPEFTPEEQEAYNNGLTILDEWGISYCIMWWFTASSGDRFGLMPPSGPTGRGMDWNNPTLLGTIVKKHLTPLPRYNLTFIVREAD